MHAPLSLLYDWAVSHRVNCGCQRQNNKRVLHSAFGLFIELRRNEWRYAIPLLFSCVLEFFSFCAVFVSCVCYWSTDDTQLTGNLIMVFLLTALLTQATSTSPLSAQPLVKETDIALSQWLSQQELEESTLLDACGIRSSRSPKSFSSRAISYVQP